MDTDIETLFGQLKAAINTSAGTNSVGREDDKKREWENQDVVAMDDEQETRRQETFQDIEKNLKRLPKLSNEFDNMAKEKQKTNSHANYQTKTQDTTAKETSVSDDWFTLPKPDGQMLANAQRDLVLIKHRSALDPKRHYKKDRWQVPERFAIGTIVEDKSEFFSSRLTNRERKSTMFDTLMSDKDKTGYFKRKYSEIQAKKTSGKKAHYKKMKSLRHR